MKKLLLLMALIHFSPAVLARMYQWVDPDTGTTQLSGKPPTWYRSSEEPGPRTFVYENGRIIDDTGIHLPPAENDKLRQEALLSVEQDRQAAMEKLQRAQQQKAALSFQDHGEEKLEEIIMDVQRREGSPDDTGPTAEQLRALIEQYEQMKTQSARELVETAEPGR